VPTAFTFSFTIARVGLVEDKLNPELLFADFDSSTAASQECTATTRKAQLDATKT
jgi:hypothetical protein